MSSVVALFDQAKVNGDVPPVVVKSIVPFVPPLQAAFVAVLVKTKAVPDGWVTVKDLTETQLFASDTATVYMPAAILVKSCVISPLAQL